MKIRKPIRTAFVLFLAVMMVLSVMPMPAVAASSAEIQKELDSLKDENKAIQAEINAIRRDFDANASDIQALVDQKNAVDQEIALLNARFAKLGLDPLTPHELAMFDEAVKLEQSIIKSMHA